MNKISESDIHKSLYELAQMIVDNNIDGYPYLLDEDGDSLRLTEDGSRIIPNTHNRSVYTFSYLDDTYGLRMFIIELLKIIAIVEIEKGL